MAGCDIANLLYIKEEYKSSAVANTITLCVYTVCFQRKIGQNILFQRFECAENPIFIT